MRTLILAIILSAFVVLAFGQNEKESQFKEWMRKYNRVYGSEEEHQKRFQIYLEASIKVAELNKNPHNVTYSLNKFADLSSEEFKAMLNPMIQTKENNVQELNSHTQQIPSTFDWCKLGKCTPIKDQGQCGSCWALSTVENVESIVAINKQPLYVLSTQQLMECDVNDYGCLGGDISSAFDYILQYGVEQASSYVETNGSCNYNSKLVVARISGYKNAYGGSEMSMAANLQSFGPLSIVVDGETWQYYTSGIFTVSDCPPNPAGLDHSALVVGYDLNQKFWNVRNTWGADWGEEGFIRLQFGTNTCSITAQVQTSYI